MNIVFTRLVFVLDKEKAMLKERLELVEHEIEKVASELVSLYDSIAIKRNASPAMEALYETKRNLMSELLSDQHKIKEILASNPNA